MVVGKPCVQCGNLVEDTARVCTQCGWPVATTVQQPPPQNQPVGGGSLGAKTMLGFSSPFAASPAPPSLQAQPPAPAPVPVPAPAPAPPAETPAPGRSAPLAQTMLGFAAPAELRAAFAARAPAPQTPAPAPVNPPSATPMAARTMLGVAIPGIAPAASAPVAPAPKMGFAGGTMMGVAMPGIAPAHSQPGITPPVAAQAGYAPYVAPASPPPPIVPAPAPLQYEAAPSAPQLASRKGGFPIGIVAAIVGVVVLGGGIALLVFARSAPPLSATATVSTDGKEQLHLRCETCADGTTAAWQSIKATFKNKEADLELPTPLSIGDNSFQIAIDRPGVGRDETVKLVLPVEYRIRGDLSGIAASPPMINVQVEAIASAIVTVDGKPVTLDASGKATLPYDVSSEATGASDDAHTIERKIPYTVTVGKEHKRSAGEVAVRVAVMPLHIDAPGASLITTDGSIWIAGRTAKGGAITANGTAIVVGPTDGAFEGKIDLTPGAQTITLIATTAEGSTTKAVPRTAKLAINRVDAVATEAATLDKAASLDFDTLARDPAAVANQPITVSGNVIEVRLAHHQSIILVDDKRGCSKPPCMVRLDWGAETPAHTGDVIDAYGVVGKSITTPDGKSLPLVEASLVVVKKARR